MKKIILSVLVVGLMNIANASDKIDPTKYKSVTIEKNISENEINIYIKEAKENGTDVIQNPKFECQNIGYSKSNGLQKGTYYGTKDKNGEISLGMVGDFKVYSFIKYFRDNSSCVENTHEKEDSHYGNNSIALLEGKNK